MLEAAIVTHLYTGKGKSSKRRSSINPEKELEKADLVDLASEI